MTDQSRTVADVAAANCDSNDYRNTFYGILNREGQFWTPIPFGSKGAAERYIVDFMASTSERFANMAATHKVVPVRIQLTHLEQSS